MLTNLGPASAAVAGALARLILENDKSNLKSFSLF